MKEVAKLNVTDHEREDNFYVQGEEDESVIAKYQRDYDKHVQYLQDKKPTRKPINSFDIINENLPGSVRNRNGAQLYEVSDDELNVSEESLQYMLEAHARAQESEDENWKIDDENPDFSTNPWYAEVQL